MRWFLDDCGKMDISTTLSIGPHQEAHTRRQAQRPHEAIWQDISEQEWERLEDQRADDVQQGEEAGEGRVQKSETGA